MLENNKDKEDEDDDEEDENFTAKDMDVIKRDLGELNGKAKGTATIGVDGANGKWKADDSRAKEDIPQKMAKISAAASSNKLTETGVQKELIRRTICDVEVDEIDGRLLVLKSQFR
ncbi:hypothetical protein PsorP6_006638 [Peronosclerospora sorghi]|uniref:Uncharacterized protein n=1 Tax=Peronosclerospora sorghi TaxID=230839 RepID=A0ACC0W6F5_9STRA|nr:hypothetical protein PsorP6_006638 [Peronosclerospora sorghi]